MPTQKMFVLMAFIVVLLIDTGILLYGANTGHTGLFEFGAEVGKVVFGTVVGALAAAFSDKG
jgi:hypothetical protein